MSSTTKALACGAAVFAVLLASGPALADAGHTHGDAAGSPGKSSAVSRTITITMRDNLFEPESISVKSGETIRFVVKNAGEFVHEFNIGTPDMHAAHQEEMLMMVDHGVLHVDYIDYAAMKMPMANGHSMEHDDPNTLLLEPGKSDELIWRFDGDGTIEFACNVPGHYDSGMYGEVQFTN